MSQRPTRQERLRRQLAAERLQPPPQPRLSIAARLRRALRRANPLQRHSAAPSEEIR